MIMIYGNVLNAVRIVIVGMSLEWERIINLNPGSLANFMGAQPFEERMLQDTSMGIIQNFSQAT